MHMQCTSSYVETIREEIKFIQNQELWYRKCKRHTSGQMKAHDSRRLRLHEIQAQLQKVAGTMSRH